MDEGKKYFIKAPQTNGKYAAGLYTKGRVKLFVPIGTDKDRNNKGIPIADIDENLPMLYPAWITYGDVVTSCVVDLTERIVHLEKHPPLKGTVGYQAGFSKHILKVHLNDEGLLTW